MNGSHSPEEAKGGALRVLRTRFRHGRGNSPGYTERRQPLFQAAPETRRSAGHKVARSQAHLRDPATVQGHAPDLRAEVSRTRIGAANARPLLPLDAEHGSQHGRRDRRGIGLEGVMN